MSLSRSPSPQDDGGWATAGLSPSYRKGAKPQKVDDPVGSGITWASAQARRDRVNGTTDKRNGAAGVGFIRRHMRKLSHSLPVFYQGGTDGNGAVARGKRKEWHHPRLGAPGSLPNRLARLAWRARLRVAVVIAFIALFLLFRMSPLQYWYRRSLWFGGGKKYVVILAANQGGGVMEWKGPREWAIERDSIRNKRKYVARWGYELEIVDMSTKKRYAHEWRESWEKVDTIRNAMRKYPQAEWFWWLDLNTFIMEPSYPLQKHIFKNLGRQTYRDINRYNVLNITHPPVADYLDEESRSPVGDGKESSIDVVLSQDCGGFNLGSFFVRRSDWVDRLLDIWWDPVAYEQKHMQWEHKEQDALEYIYTNQPWARTHVAFMPQRKLNSFPAGACGEMGENKVIHYRERDRDFLVNMAGCEWGRDCWGEMYKFRELSNKLNRTVWEKFKEELVAKAWKAIVGRRRQ